MSTTAQFLDWLDPIDPRTLEGESVLEMGSGKGSLLAHLADYRPAKLTETELDDPGQADLGAFDLVYCIGVLHHLRDPAAGFDAVVRNTRPGGRFHCWVYAEEGNAVVIRVVDPIRRVTCNLPPWITRYGVALPLAVPYFFYAKAVAGLADVGGPVWHLVSSLPLADYSQWIAQRSFRFLHHVAFDHLITPRTQYLSRDAVESLLRHPDVDPQSVYVASRNGNSWKFGGRRRGS
jgi:SAM-dependent methyltransferase